MPPIFLHMALSKDVRHALDHDLIERHNGAFYFGATTPDIRVLTRGDRRDTHYFDLDELQHQDSVEEFFKAQPQLAAPEQLDEQAIAFVSGYLTHLVLDQSYIEKMYRPYFGQLSALGGSVQADTMDRLLQYELDRRRREHTEEVEEIRQALQDCSLTLDVGFLDSETLLRWQQVAIDMTRHPPTYDRFRNHGGRHLRQSWIEDERAYQDFLQRIPELLQQTLNHVSTAQVDAFLDQAKERAQRVLERYLGCES